MNKKRCTAAGCLMVLIAVAYIVYAVRFSAPKFPWHIGGTYTMYGLYIILTGFVFAFPHLDGLDILDLAALVLVMAALLFFVCAFLEFAVNEVFGWYLPAAFVFNIAGFVLSVYNRRRRKKSRWYMNKK